MLVLGVESSCDETSVAIYDGQKMLSNVVLSQIDVHKQFGGVVPEVASRHHVRNVSIVFKEALEKANVSAKDIDLVAVTEGPGLIGSLLVGITAAKTFALAYGIPIIGVNHLAGHIYANQIEGKMKFPLLALLVSGGNTELILMKDHFEFEIIGQTLDDAVGEAYDKVARLIGLPYPGGPRLDKLAQEGNPKAFELPEGKVDGYNFSFSGLKTAVLRLVKSFDGQELPVNDICASFQECVSKTLVKKLRKAVLERGYSQVVIAGGVAANSEIRKKVFDLEKEGFRVCAPPMKYCTDNASMVASCAYFNTNTFDDIDIEVFSRVK